MFTRKLSPDEQARQQAEEKALRETTEAKDAAKAAFDALPLVEQNEIKLTELEQEWSALGPIREITFTVFFGEESEADILAKIANEKGFNTKIITWSSETRNYQLIAKILMQPVTEHVTSWEEWFKAYALKVPDFDNGEYLDVGADFKGWSYPKRLSPSFFLKGEVRSKMHQNSQGARDRTSVLFGQTLCDFEASNGWASNKTNLLPSSTFDFKPSKFLENARRNRPSNPAPTASMFSQWLYSLYANAYGNDQDRAKGKEAEEHILIERQKSYATTDHDFMSNYFPDWRLKHNGMTHHKTDRPSYYSVNDLMVNGEPLRLNPDLIYENKRTKEAIIVEIKHSLMDIPRNLWPNIWGQLWCYAQIQELRGFSRVTVIGEVWGDKYYRGGYQYLYQRASVRRNPRSIAYDRFFRTLFDIYRGVE